MPAPLFSVILPTFNRPEMLQEAVDSVLAQTIPELECIVVDDASAEPVVVLHDSRVRVVRRPMNGGPGAARNTGIALASGRYVVFLDDDELFTKDRLEVALEGLERAEIALCWRRSKDEPMDPHRIRLEGSVGARVLEDAIPHLGVTALRRDTIQRFDERLRVCEDVEWWIRTAPGRSFATVPKFGCLMRSRPATYAQQVAGPRAAARLEILTWHAEYFATNPRAAAVQWRRLGFQARAAGNRTLAQRAFVRSLRYRVSPRTLWHLLHTLVPQGPHLGP
jgi:glycosyltransferase involved in cell wall biosynthesis